jgi:outer membrane protein insertion porin family
MVVGKRTYVCDLASIKGNQIVLGWKSDGRLQNSNSVKEGTVVGPENPNRFKHSQRASRLARLPVNSQVLTVALVAILTALCVTGAPAQTPAVTNGEAPGQTLQTTTANPTPPAAAPQASQTVPSLASSQTSVNNTLPALSATIWDKRGVPVTSIRFDGVVFGANDAILHELTQKAGQPLDPDKVRSDMRRLFASGRYRDISVSGESAASGITLIYAGTPRYYVGRIEIDGVKEERLTSLLEFATRLDPGTAYTEAAIPAAVEGIKQTLAENGYYEGTVKAETAQDDAGHQVNATFIVHLGPQARVGNVAVGGKDPGITVEEFRKKAKLDCSRLALKFRKNCRVKVGRETTSTALADVRSYYQKKDRLEATVSMQKQTYDQSVKRLNYDFVDEQGPVVNVVINGVKISKSRMRLLVPVFEEGAVDRDLLNEGAFNIRDYLQQQGYFNAQAQVKFLGKGTPNVTVEYDVTLGDRHKVTEVKLKGNKYFDSDILGDLLRVHKADAYVRNGKYSSQLVNADVNSILSLYRANGFSNAKVTSSVKDMDTAPNGQHLKVAQIQVTFEVVEGTQQKFGPIELAGIDPSRKAAVQSLLNAQKGQPFSLITLSGDRDAVLSYYIANGFDHAKVEIAQNVEDGDPTKTDVTLNITEGQQVFIDQVLLSGIVHTRPSVVQKQLTVHAGQPLDQAALLETQRRLYNLALFNEVNAAVQNPSGDAPSKNVLVQLTEAKRWDVTYGFGFEAQTGLPGITTGQTRGTTAAQNGQAGVSPRVSLDVSRINLRGTQDSLTLHTTYGLLEEIATLSFNNPQFLGHRNFTATVSGGYSNVQNISTFASSALQGDFRISQKVKKADNLIYDFQFRRVSINPDSLEITPNLIPQLSEPVTVGGPGITYFHDTRDPSPLNANRGQYFSIQEFIASSKFGSDTDFNKVDISQSTYYTFGKRKYVFARNLRVGFENSFGPNPNAVPSGSGQIGVPSTACSGTLLETNPTCVAVPLPERLYAGGATSHRGFGTNDAGPRDLTTGYPVGGTGVVVNTFELRLPPPTLPLVGDSISFVIFHDMGNSFQYIGDMFKSIKNFRQPNQDTCRNITVAAGQTPDTTVGTCSFNFYAHAVGVGLRYGTPVGPIRVDFSYNLNPPIYPVFDDYTGAAPYVGQASHFNFFFSIGQSF